MVLEEINVEISQQSYGVPPPASRKCHIREGEWWEHVCGWSSDVDNNILDSLALRFVVRESIPGCHGVAYWRLSILNAFSVLPVTENLVVEIVSTVYSFFQRLISQFFIWGSRKFAKENSAPDGRETQRKTQRDHWGPRQREIERRTWSWHDQ